MQMLSIVQISLAILLITLVLIQKANTDAAGAFSSDGSTNFALEKRGAEKKIHNATILVAISFVVSLAIHLFK